MKQQVKKLTRRWLALLLCMCMAFPSMTSIVSAVEPQVSDESAESPDEEKEETLAAREQIAESPGMEVQNVDPTPQTGEGEIGDVLDGDYAYISDAAISRDETTESGLAIRTGTAPWDDMTGNGNDESDLNNTVRSFDEVTYTVEFQTKVRDGSPYKAYRTGTLHFEFILPATSGQAQFDTGSMGWLESKQGQYTITEATYNGEPCQVLKGTCVLEPADNNPSAIGESWQTLNLAVRTLAVKQGEVIRPEFTFWLDHNDVPAEGLVTGSGHSCTAHGEQEFKTIDSPEIAVTSAPRFNVQIKTGFTSTQYLGNFDFATGNDKAQNKDGGTRYGRVQAFGVTLQIAGKSAQHGLRGCELPDGNPITFNLDLSSSYRSLNGETQDVSEEFTPLLWSAEGNSEAASQQDGRVIAANDRYAFLAAPFNVGDDYRSCKNGGEWTATQSGQTIQVTVSGYEADLSQLPYTDAKNDPAVYTYYNPNTSKGYWDIQTACFSAGEFWIVQPFYDAQGEYIADKYGNGNFTMTVEDSSLMVTGESGQSLEQTDDNSNQIVTTDDRQSATMALEQPGEIEQYIRYAGTDVTNTYHDEGKDWILSGGEISIQEQLAHLGAEGLHTAVAYDDLMKFDDTFFDIESVQIETVNGVENLAYRFLYGAKADKSGWDHDGKSPEEEGYDAEMMNATADDLIFFSSLDKLKSQGYICVAVLMEARGVGSSQSTEIYFTAQGSLKENAQSGKVYMVTHSAKAWNKEDVQEAAAAAMGKDASELSDNDYKTYAQNYFPSRADQMTSPDYGEDYPESFWTNDSATRDGLKNYLKSQYDEDGYKDGTAGRNYGDSCLVADYATQIEKKRAQNTTGSDGQSGEKYSYDLDSGQSIADYILTPLAIRTEGEFSSEGEIITTVYVEDILPKGLTYIPFSGFWGGTYVQNGEGKQGSITDGVQVEPEIRENKDGTTTLLWTLEDVMVTAEAVTTIDPIYYSCDIGNKDTVNNNQELVNTVKIWSDHEQKKDFAEVNGNLADVGIRVVKNLAVSLSKLADQTEVEAGEDMGFTMNVGNNAGNPLEVIAVDSLPYNGDDAGSVFTGDCVVNEFSITSLQEQFGGENFKLYYTEDEALRGKTSKDFTKESFTDPDSGWVELEVDSESGAVTLPQTEFKPVAIVAVGSLPANQTLKMHVTVNLPEGRAGEHVVNCLTNNRLESYGRSYVVGRTLEGVVWLDADKNGLRAGSEAMQDGVTATLMKLKKGGDASEIKDYEPYKVNGKEVSVATGQQINVLTGTVSAYSTGNYKFVNVPEGTFGVRFSDGIVKLSDYEASPVNVEDDDTIDSDADPSYKDGVMQTAFIPGINMPAAEDIGGTSYESKYNDMGIYPADIPEPINVHVEKIWDDAGNQDGKRPADVQVQLYADGKESGEPVTLSAGNSWSHTWSDLDAKAGGKDIAYTVKEVGEEDGKITFSNGAQYSVTYGGDAAAGYTVTNSYTPETIDISGSKTWDDGDDQDGKRPESITINLLADGTEVQETQVTEKENWKWTFTNLPKYKDGKVINYTITEDTVDGYTPSYKGYDVTNSYTPGKTAVTVTKSWQDNNDQDGLRPQYITVKLLADGKDTGKKVTLNEGNNWTGTFSNLDEYADGVKIVYTVEEVSVEGYDTLITGDASSGYTITNSHTPETVDISGSKTWDDADNQDGKRPESITINLLADGEQRQSVEVSPDSNGNWTWNFEELPKYKNGRLITYTITENAVPDYTTKVEGYDVTNSYTPGKTSVSVTKAWDDAGNQDGKRPADVQVQLYADGKESGDPVTLSQGNSWSHTWSDLDAKASGKDIAYTVKEVGEEDGKITFSNGAQYSVTYGGDAAAGYTVTNSYTPETIDISGSKTWDDGDDQDGKRPESIMIRLLANGKEAAKQTVSAESGWTWKFENMPKYEAGKEIVYTITEDAVADYTTSINGYNVTNSYTPGKISIAVTKAWEDHNNQDGIRPEEITVKLLADGKDTGKKLTLSSENSWSGSFSELDEYAKAEKIQYTIEEEKVDGYVSVITGDVSEGLTITNIHTPETIDISGSKTWDDADDQDGKRPDSITVRLYANGAESAGNVQTVTAEDRWSWNFTNLPKYENGEEIIYTIREDQVTGYQPEIEGYNIINSYTPGKVSVSVSKSWKDSNDQDGIRPDTVTIRLLADGKDTGKTLILSETNQWTGSFVDLDEYKDGEKINYSITEDHVKGYQAVIAGNAENGFVVTNSHTPDTPQDTPKTGDPEDLSLWTALLGLAGISLAAGCFCKVRKRKTRKR